MEKRVRVIVIGQLYIDQESAIWENMVFMVVLFENIETNNGYSKWKKFEVEKGQKAC